MEKMDDAALTKEWTVRRGDQVMYRESRATILRVWWFEFISFITGPNSLTICGLLNVPVPAIYFNSSDEPEWVFELRALTEFPRECLG